MASEPTNTGDCNTGDYNTGFFCVNTPKPTFFDHPFDGTWEEAQGLIPAVDLPIGCEWVPTDKMTDDEKAENPNHATTGGFLRVLHRTVQEAFPLAWAKMDQATRDRFTSLPNFDAEKFLKCTGVDVRGRTITLEDGRKVKISVESYNALQDAAKGD